MVKPYCMHSCTENTLLQGKTIHDFSDNAVLTKCIICVSLAKLYKNFIVIEQVNFPEAISVLYFIQFVMTSKHIILIVLSQSVSRGHSDCNLRSLTKIIFSIFMLYLQNKLEPWYMFVQKKWSTRDAGYSVFNVIS